MALLNVALMSSVLGIRSLPKRLLAWATANHVIGEGAPAKSRTTLTGPADPSTAEVELHVNGLNCAPTRIVTGLVRSEPQMFAACWNALKRWAPIVVPVFPPTGMAGVGSLNPSPAPS